MKPQNLSIDDIAIGDSVSFTHVFTALDVSAFAKLSGDENPLHTDDVYAATTKFKHRLVHGMLVGSLCSQLVGMHIPGKKCLYLSQTLSFKNPVFIDDIITVFGTVQSKSISTGILEILIVIKKENQIVLDGIAHVQIL